MADKRATLDELIGELRSGMTIGIGGWGSRRKPMAAVRAILRSDLEDLTIVSYGGPAFPRCSSVPLVHLIDYPISNTR